MHSRGAVDETIEALHLSPSLKVLHPPMAITRDQTAKIPWVSGSHLQQDSPKQKKHMDQHGHQTTPLIRTMPKVGFSMRERERETESLSESGRIDNKYFSVVPFQGNWGLTKHFFNQPDCIRSRFSDDLLSSHRKMA